jgi:hypothetical protein
MPFEDAETLAYMLSRVFTPDFKLNTLSKIFQTHRATRIAKVMDFTGKEGNLRKHELSGELQYDEDVGRATRCSMTLSLIKPSVQLLVKSKTRRSLSSTNNTTLVVLPILFACLIQYRKNLKPKGC